MAVPPAIQNPPVRVPSTRCLRPCHSQKEDQLLFPSVVASGGFAIPPSAKSSPVLSRSDGGPGTSVVGRGRMARNAIKGRGTALPVRFPGCFERRPATNSSRPKRLPLGLLHGIVNRGVEKKAVWEGGLPVSAAEILAELAKLSREDRRRIPDRILEMEDEAEEAASQSG